MKGALTFEALIGAIQATDAHFAAEAVRAVNIGLSLRNWCFGLSIAAFELRGADRARYGDRLVETLSDELKSRGISNVGRRQLYQYIAFYRTYPELVRTLPAPALALVPGAGTAAEIVRTASAQSGLPPDVLVASLAYSHFELLVGLEDDARRRFYEVETVRGRWSVLDKVQAFLLELGRGFCFEARQKRISQARAHRR